MGSFHIGFPLDISWETGHLIWRLNMENQRESTGKDYGLTTQIAKKVWPR